MGSLTNGSLRESQRKKVTFGLAPPSQSCWLNGGSRRPVWMHRPALTSTPRPSASEDNNQQPKLTKNKKQKKKRMKVANKYERIFSVAWCRIFQHIFSVNDLLELNTHTHTKIQSIC